MYPHYCHIGWSSFPTWPPLTFEGGGGSFLLLGAVGVLAPLGLCWFLTLAGSTLFLLPTWPTRTPQEVQPHYPRVVVKVLILYQASVDSQPKGAGCLLTARWAGSPRRMVSTVTAGVGILLPPASDESPGSIFWLSDTNLPRCLWGMLDALLQPGGKSRLPIQPLLSHRVGQSTEVIV